MRSYKPIEAARRQAAISAEIIHDVKIYRKVVSGEGMVAWRALANKSGRTAFLEARGGCQQSSIICKQQHRLIENARHRRFPARTRENNRERERASA